jgi:glycosyltransferase involved in cell wall biosynthesis
LEIAGSEERDPHYAAKIRGLVSAEHLEDRIKLLGAISEDELVKKYRETDVFAFPNSPQTWGLSVFEAMACGAPAVVSRGCGASEVLTDGENALLVEPARPEAISDAISRLMDDAALYAKLSRVGRRYVEENITWEAYGSRMMDVFKQVTKKGGERAWPLAASAS